MTTSPPPQTSSPPGCGRPPVTSPSPRTNTSGRRRTRRQLFQRSRVRFRWTLPRCYRACRRSMLGTPHIWTQPQQLGRGPVETWEDAFTAVYRQAPFPGGTVWLGDAADAAMLRAGSDRRTVLGAVDALRDAASVARSGASEIQAATQLVPEAVNAAEAAGFTVREDLSVTDRQTGGPPALQAARQAQAEGLTATIRSRAALLAAVEERVAIRITSATASLRGTRFAPNPVVPPKEEPSVQALDNRTFPQEPPPGTPDDPDTKLIKPGQDVRDVLDKLRPGRNFPVVTLPRPEEIHATFERLTDNALDTPRPNYDGPSRSPRRQISHQWSTPHRSPCHPARSLIHRPQRFRPLVPRHRCYRRGCKTRRLRAFKSPRASP
jgi:hypothetical protein